MKPTIYNDWVEDIPSIWKDHRLFVNWLVNYLQPMEIIDFGVDYGYTTFVWQDAIQFKIDCLVTGVDLFQPDPKTNIRNTFNFINEKILNYGLTSIDIIVGDFKELSEKWPKTRLLDIIHFKDCHPDFTCWLPFLKNDGVILFHDINFSKEKSGFDDSTGLKTNIQESIFFNQLSVPGYIKFKFLPCRGLGILTKNTKLYDCIVKDFGSTDVEVI